MREAAGSSGNAPLACRKTEKVGAAPAAKFSGTDGDDVDYDAYLAGKVAPSGLRRLFLAHLDEPGLARKVCTAVIAKLRTLSNAKARAVHA